MMWLRCDRFSQKAHVNACVCVLTHGKTLSGLILIPGAGLGQFLGGFIIQKLGLQVRGSLIVAIITKGASVPLTIMFLFTCDKMDLAGWSAPYDNQLR